jgi:hypothetical protein
MGAVCSDGVTADRKLMHDELEKVLQTEAIIPMKLLPVRAGDSELPRWRQTALSFDTPLIQVANKIQTTAETGADLW